MQFQTEDYRWFRASRCNREGPWFESIPTGIGTGSAPTTKTRVLEGLLLKPFIILIIFYCTWLCIFWLPINFNLMKKSNFRVFYPLFVNSIFFWASRPLSH
jgi:hypothetical protein